MIERLGNVLYWACNTLSALILFGVTGMGYFNTGSFQVLALTAPIAVLISLLGRAALYILSGR
jgi:hypothetical protein